MTSRVRKHPELMVVGDSLAQGIRSLSINRAYAEMSYPAVIARSQGWHFQVPTFPRPVLVDLEDAARKLGAGTVSGLVGDAKDNLKEWQTQLLKRAGRTDFPAAFDNLAIGGMNMERLFSWTAGTCREELRAEVTKDDEISLELDRISDVHLKVNTAFVLNPRQLPSCEDLTPLDWVRKREPKRLIFHCGHNDGLYRIGADANEEIKLGDTWKTYEPVLRSLDNLPASIGMIVVVGFPCIAAVANLRPKGPLDPYGYAESYLTEFPMPGRAINGRLLRRFDQELVGMNEATRQIIGGFRTSARFRFVNTYGLLRRYDFKNSGDPSRQLKLGRFLIDNRYLNGERRETTRRNGTVRQTCSFSHGGLQSLDGMHPSAIGYTIMAMEVMKQMMLRYDKQSLLKEALAAERLVTRYDKNLHNFSRSLEMVGNLRDQVAGARDWVRGLVDSLGGRGGRT